MESPFRAIAEYTYDWESWIDPEGQLRWVNAAVERITGYGVAECLEMADYPLPLVHAGDRPAVARVLQQAREGQSGNHFEFRVLRKDGEMRWAAISWQPITVEGKRVGFRSSVRDIHQRKEMEAELQQAVQRAEAANHAKSEFLANVTHELRTPLQSIIGYAQLLAAADLAQPHAEYVRTLQQQSEHLEHLVSDLLDYSALQGGMLALRAERHEPDRVLAHVVDGLMPLATAKGLKLTRQGAVAASAVGDARRLGQVLTNLIGNAIKYTPEGRVEVSAGHSPERGEYWICVDDTGPGLPAGELFQPFVQGKVPEGGRGEGVGLGLAISHQFCTRMGGSLEPSTSPLGGARLMVRLPLSAASDAHQVAHFDESAVPLQVSGEFARRHPLSVLVVDDVEALRTFLGEALRALGYQPQLAAGADEAFALAEEHTIDLALVDIQMPGVDGWGAARGLRARLGEGAYLVALTAQSSADDADRLERAGFDGYANKPMRMGTLQALLQRAHARRVRLGAAESGASGEVGTATDDSLTDDSLFNASRWQEMRQIRTQSGGTLLELMQSRVATALPEVLQRIDVANETEDPAALRRAVHDAGGLFALIGARQAQHLAERCEEQGALASSDAVKRLTVLAQEVVARLLALRE